MLTYFSVSLVLVQLYGRNLNLKQWPASGYTGSGYNTDDWVARRGRCGKTGMSATTPPPPPARSESPPRPSGDAGGQETLRAAEVVRASLEAAELSSAEISPGFALFLETEQAEAGGHPRQRRSAAAHWFGGGDGSADEWLVRERTPLRVLLDSESAVLCHVELGAVVRSYGSQAERSTGLPHIRVTVVGGSGGGGRDGAGGGAAAEPLTGWLAIRGRDNRLLLERRSRDGSTPGGGGGGSAAATSPTTPGARPPAVVSTAPRSVAPMVLHALQTKAAQALEAGRLEEHQLYCEQIIALKTGVDGSTAAETAKAEPIMHRALARAGRYAVEISVYELGQLKEKLGANFGAYHTAVVVHGEEWSFGHNNREGATGVFRVQPGQCLVHHYLLTEYAGETSLGPVRRGCRGAAAGEE
eukprot:SAG22_NODE_714_length_7722_cov_3.919585_10_plen_414_part_00